MAAWVKSLAGSMVLSAAMIVLGVPAALAQTPAQDAPAASDQSPFLSTAVFSTAFAAVLNGRQEVWIMTVNGTRLKVRVAAVAPAGLTVTDLAGQSQTVPFGDITRIEKVSHRLSKNTKVGFGIGLGIGVYGALICGQAARGCQAPILLVYSGIGAGFGALIGALKNAAHRDGDVVYDAAVRKKTTVAMTPIVSRTRKGAALSITWR